MKVIYRDETIPGGNLDGFNVAFGFLAWGRFRVRFTSVHTLVLDYSLSRWPLSGIRDHIDLDKGYDRISRGEFYYLFPLIGRRRLFRFSMVLLNGDN